MVSTVSRTTVSTGGTPVVLVHDQQTPHTVDESNKSHFNLNPRTHSSLLPHFLYCDQLKYKMSGLLGFSCKESLLALGRPVMCVTIRQVPVLLLSLSLFFLFCISYIVKGFSLFEFLEGKVTQSNCPSLSFRFLPKKIENGYENVY